MANFWQQLDNQLSAGLADWNIYTTLLCLIIIAYGVYPAFFSPEPDIHPLLLARQSAPSRVRQSGESATYRSLDIPHSYPLRKGLNVKDPGQPRWTAGRDGDLRDIWTRAVSGPVDADGKPTGQPPGKISVVLGKEEVITHDFGKLTAEVNAVGKHLHANGAKRVAIYLSNSVEFLVTLFGMHYTEVNGLAELIVDHSLFVLWVDTNSCTTRAATGDLSHHLERNASRCIHIRGGRCSSDGTCQILHRS